MYCIFFLQRLAFGAKLSGCPTMALETPLEFDPGLLLEFRPLLEKKVVILIGYTSNIVSLVACQLCLFISRKIHFQFFVGKSTAIENMFTINCYIRYY